MKKIISGGQTGADQGALVAGRQLGLETGGWMPRGFFTECGPAPLLAEMYGMSGHPSGKYPPRTIQNVRDADATVWIGKADSFGYRCTKKAADALEKPFWENLTAEELRGKCYEHNVQILNVAGPRASRDANAHRRTAELLIEAFGDKR